MTLIDVTENRFLESKAVNTTDIVTMDGVSAGVSRSGKNIDATVRSIEFHTSSAKPVWLSDATGKASQYEKTKRIGTVTYTLLEASLSVSSGTELNSILVRLADGQKTENGLSLGAEVFPDSYEELRWRIQPTYPRIALQARLETLRLCSARFSPEADLTVTVSIQKNEIEPRITLTQPQKNWTTQEQKTKDRLIEQIFRNRLPDTGLRDRIVLSHGRAIPE